VGEQPLTGPVVAHDSHNAHRVASAAILDSRTISRSRVGRIGCSRFSIATGLMAAAQDLVSRDPAVAVNPSPLRAIAVR
jgi:hypothetical protein